MVYTIKQTRLSPNRTWIIENNREQYGIAFSKAKAACSYNAETKSGEGWTMCSEKSVLYKEGKAVVKDDDKTIIGEIISCDDCCHEILYKNTTYQMYIASVSEKEKWLCFYDEDMEIAAVKMTYKNKTPLLKAYCLTTSDLNYILPMMFRFIEIYESKSVAKKAVLNIKSKKNLSKHNAAFVELCKTPFLPKTTTNVRFSHST